MSNQEQQEEEYEVLKSIFEDDEAFNFLSENKFQYKFGDDGHPKSFITEISFIDSYPETLPCINLDTFYNKHLLPSVKTSILEKINEFAESMVGEPLVYSIIDFINENYDDLISEQPLQVVEVVIPEETKNEPSNNNVKTSNKKEKKEQLTKAQKRKLADRVNINGERPRGWNWVDLIKHLSQTGRVDDN